MNLRRDSRRFAWLMTGAAIGTTVVLVVALVVPVLREPLLPVPLLVLAVLLAALLGGLLGLVPGVRELEVTAARSMLGVDSELVVPPRPGLVHRVQDVLWVQVHLLLGLLAAACLTMLLPAAVVTLLGAAGVHSGLEIVPVPSAPVARIVLGALSVLALLGALLAAWPLGALAARLALSLLGPTAGDRLAVALDRADREAEHTRIARDLHDGIGHSLTIVSIQAAAGGRVLERDPAAAGEALARIERTAREALVELDGVLATLREERADGEQCGGVRAVGRRADGAPATALPPRLEAVLEDHRRAGMDLRAEVEMPPDLSPVQGEHLVRIVTELLTNAHRHGGEGPVRLRVRIGQDEAGGRAVVLEAVNPLAASADSSASRDRATPEGPADPSSTRQGGRGLPGLRERLALWGGMLEAGPHEDTWRARAVLPILLESPRP